MIRPRDVAEADTIRQRIVECPIFPQLLGIDEETLEVLIAQVLESLRRNRFIEHLGATELSGNRTDPISDLFDPLRASILLRRRGDIDEAFWMVFLYTHFGKHRRSGYGYARDVYGRMGAGTRWSWVEVAENLTDFRQWLQDHQAEIKARHRPGGFGNHRKYESLDGWSYSGTGSVVESYVDWVGEDGHLARIDAISAAHHADCFDGLYGSLDNVHRFGRTARFDYLMTAHKVGLVDCRPTHAFLRGATGPAKGVRLMVTGEAGGPLSPRDQDAALATVEDCLGVGYDVLEDALCNWQKSPRTFKPFRG